MFDISEIKGILNVVIEVEKNVKKDEKPSFGLRYDITTNLAEEISVHANGTFPTKLLEARAPNEQTAEYDYRRDNYQPVTKPIWRRAAKVINRIWNKSNYSIKYSEESTDYFTVEYPDFTSIDNYFEQVVTPHMLADPNSLLCVKPRALPEKIDENGDLIPDQSQLIEPIAVIYSSFNVIVYERGSHSLVKLNETSRLKDGARGLIFEFYDDTNIYRITQVGDKSDWTFEIDLYYAHQLGYVPVWRLPGNTKQIQDFSYNESYFSDALPHLNRAIVDESTLDISKKTQAFPILVLYKDVCKNTDCIDGRIKYYDDDKEKHLYRRCETCQGNERPSPAGILQIDIPRPGSLDAENFANIPNPPVSFQAPDPTILEFSRKEINNAEEKAFTFVGINVSDSDVIGSETALGKQIDRDEEFSFILNISNHTFALMGNVIDGIGEMRYISFESPEITEPISFQMRNEKELMIEIGLGFTDGLPEVGMKKLFREWFNLRFNLNKNKEKIVDLIFFSDRLIAKNDLMINAGLALNKWARWEVYLHDTIEILIKSQDDSFFEQEMETQKATLIALAQTQFAALVPVTTNVLTQFEQGLDVTP